MKAMLRFDLPEESEEHQTALDGWKWRMVVEQIDNHFRSKLKYEDLSEEDDAVYQAVREELHNIIDQQGLSIW